MTIPPIIKAAARETISDLRQVIRFMAYISIVLLAAAASIALVLWSSATFGWLGASITVVAVAVGLIFTGNVQIALRRKNR